MDLLWKGGNNLNNNTMKKYKSYYINLLLTTNDRVEFEAEKERLKYIVGSHPKPLRSEAAQSYVDFIHKNCYEGNQACSLMQEHFGVTCECQDLKTWMKETKLTEDELREAVSEFSKQAKVKIDAAFKKHEKKLKKLYDEIHS